MKTSTIKFFLFVLISLLFLEFDNALSLTSNNLAGDSCIISGPITVHTNITVLYTTDNPTGRWEVFSYNGAFATITGGNGFDSIIVNTGPSLGNFNVYVFNDSLEVLCSLVVTIDVQLPVKLNLFTATVNNRDVKLFWSTFSEENNLGFDIEKSSAIGGVNPEPSGWHKIGFVRGTGTNSLGGNYEFTDRNLSSGKYKYRLKQIDYNGNFEYYELQNEIVIGIPGKFYLHQNYPNPFNPTTVINFELPAEGFVLLKVYDVLGNVVSELINEKKEAGYYTINFNGTNLPAGIYFYKIEFGNMTMVRKMILLN